MADDDPIQLLRDLLDRVEGGFAALGSRVNGLERRVDEAHGGVKMTLAGLEGIQHKVDTMANGVVQLSTQISQLRAGVAEQVAHEVSKNLDGKRTIEERAERAHVDKR